MRIPWEVRYPHKIKTTVDSAITQHQWVKSILFSLHYLCLPSSPKDRRGGETREPHIRNHGEEAEPYMPDMWEELRTGSLPHVSPTHAFQEGRVRQMSQVPEDVHIGTHTEGGLVDECERWVGWLVGGWVRSDGEGERWV